MYIMFDIKQFWFSDGFHIGDFTSIGVDQTIYNSVMLHLVNFISEDSFQAVVQIIQLAKNCSFLMTLISCMHFE